MITSEILRFSTQINNGLDETAGDGVGLAFDSKYGVCFCAYMPGPHGTYGESRGRICLSYFPASQPTNIKFVEIASGNSEYCQNLFALGDGKVRVFYEKDSRAEGDHDMCYKDFNYITGELSEEKIVMLKREDGSIVKLNITEQFKYLEDNGFHNHEYCQTEQISFGSHTIFRGEDGYAYGVITSYLAEPILYRSNDDLATLEFFAICPYTAQYEMDYKILNGKIYGVFRTPPEKDSIFYVTSDDMGKTWSKPVVIKDSVSCRSRVIVYNNDILIITNHFNADTGNRPTVIQGRTCLRLRLGTNPDPNKNKIVAELYSKCGMVNCCLVDIMGDAYLGYSTSELAIDYFNGTPWVRGKDAVRFVKLGDLTE
ncbi:MAG: exo-alpha-sialidase [Clostridia bacterium]|nr:exo-alpha-sialidase [Clostridia bacterium]